MFLFFSFAEPHIVLILFLYFCFQFRLNHSICQKIFSSVAEITPHLVDKLSFDIYLLIRVHICFPNLDKKFFVQPQELGKKYDSNFIFTFAAIKVRYGGITTAKMFKHGNYLK